MLSVAFCSLFLWKKQAVKHVKWYFSCSVCVQSNMILWYRTWTESALTRTEVLTLADIDPSSSPSMQYRIGTKLVIYAPAAYPSGCDLCFCIQSHLFILNQFCHFFFFRFFSTVEEGVWFSRRRCSMSSLARVCCCCVEIRDANN